MKLFFVVEEYTFAQPKQKFCIRDSELLSSIVFFSSSPKLIRPR